MLFFKKINLLFSVMRTKGIWLLYIGVLFRAILEVAGVASIAPFVAVTTNPEIVHSNTYLSLIYQYFEFLSVNDFLYSLGIITLAVLVVSNFFSAFLEWFIVRFSKRLEHELSFNLFGKYLQKEYSYFLRKNSAELGKNILSEVKRCVDGVIFPLITTLSKLVSVLFMVVLIFYINPIVSLSIFFIVGSVYWILISFAKNKLYNAGISCSNAMKECFKVANEAFSGIKDIKLHHTENDFIEKYKIPSREHTEKYINQHVISTVPKYVLETISFGGIVLIMLSFIAGGKDSSEIISLMALYAMAGYRLMPSLQHIYSSIVTIRFNSPSLDIVMNNIGIYSQKNINVCEKNVLNFNHFVKFYSVKYKYHGAEKNTLNGIDMTINVNETIGIVGSTGSGKTTLVDIFLGILQHNSGDFYVDDIAINEENKYMWQKKLSYVPQHIFLTDDTIAANIAFGVGGGEIDIKKVENSAKTANLHTFVNSLPDRYNTKIGEKGVRLSGGQIQRIGIARALYRDTEVLVLDEATSALDGITENSVMGAIKNLSDKMTIIIIAHRLSTIRHCDVIYLLNNGLVEDKGDYDSLYKGNKIFRKMSNNKSK